MSITQVDELGEEIRRHIQEIRDAKAKLEVAPKEIIQPKAVVGREPGEEG
jgi:hypothetical protein